MSTRIAPNSNVPVVCLRPGLNRNLLSNKVDLSKPRTPYCLFMGRLEDGDLKGAGLACQMIRTLNLDWPWQAATRPRLILRGFDPANLDSEIAAIGGIEDAKPYLVPRPYTPDSETIANDIRSSCVIIMPSKREGFGLVALEGIAAGIPVLVTAESGMGEMLLQNDIATAIGQSVAEGCVADVDGDIEKIRKDWATRAQKILSDPSKAFASAEQVRLALQPLLSWEKAAEQFSSDIESILT